MAIVSRALDAARAQKYDQATQIARNSRSQIALDIVQWQALRDGVGRWSDYADFLKRNGDWPGLKLMRRRAESKISSRLPNDQIRAFFGKSAPQTARGALVLAGALDKSEAKKVRIRAWQTLPMNEPVFKAYLADHRAQIKPHHSERMTNLLWAGHTKSAAAMLPLVSKSDAALARARIALQERKNGVDKLIAAIPGKAKNDPGLAYDRFAWRLSKGLRDSAATLLNERSSSAASLGRPEKWASSRRSLAREAMRNGRSKTAYALASRHHLTSGSNFADLEWLSGYIALTYMKDPARALTHFERFEAAVETPISLGRAGYWKGQAAEAAGDREAARNYYGFGAAFQTSFYGQLSAERAGVAVDPTMKRWGGLPSWKNTAFVRSSPILAARLLDEAGDRVLAQRFLLHVQESLGPQESAALARFAIDLDQISTAVKIGKRLVRQGVILPEAYYPVTSLANQARVVSPELALSIARQETELNPLAVSPAGARGLMQLMPRTAQKVASQLGMKYSSSRLISDPKYNARLGTQYLADMLKRYNGSVLLAAAAYNAGPGRVDQWIATYGDPRRPDVDAIRWIEHMPFRETRNYVMRILESQHVYRTRIARKAGPIGLTQQLRPES